MSSESTDADRRGEAFGKQSSLIETLNIVASLICRNYCANASPLQFAHPAAIASASKSRKAHCHHVAAAQWMGIRCQRMGSESTDAGRQRTLKRTRIRRTR
jgi:hypothetical protein